MEEITPEPRIELLRWTDCIEEFFTGGPGLAEGLGLCDGAAPCVLCQTSVLVFPDPDDYDEDDEVDLLREGLALVWLRDIGGKDDALHIICDECADSDDYPLVDKVATQLGLVWFGTNIDFPRGDPPMA